MITLLKQDSFSKALMLVGLEGDTKPIESFTFKGAVLPIRNGSTFYEADTATFYVYDGDSDTWIKQSGGGGYPEPTGTVQITQNGTGIDVKDYAEADVAVENSYTQADEGKVVDNGALVSQTSKNINANGTIDTTKNNEVVVNVPNTYAAGDEGKVVENGSLVAQSSQSISANGTYDTTKKNEVVVNVISTNREAEIIEGTLSGDYTGSATLLKSRIFMNNTTLTGIHFPNCLEVASQACCIDNTTMRSILSVIDLPIATKIGYASFSRVGNGLPNDTYLVVNIPSAVQLNSNAFESCKKLKKINLPACTSLGESAFATCSSLDQVDLGYVGDTVVSIGERCMFYCPLTALILRNTLGVATLANTAALMGTNIAAGTGYIYTPRSIKSTYEAATNWVTYASQFRALEDYTVDGTTTGALDPNKI